MKLRLVIVSIVLSIAFVVSAVEDSLAQDEQASTEKTYCTYAYAYGDAETMKNDLLINVKRQAVNEIFGELISAMTVVDNSVVTSDQIRASSLGFVRVSGNPEYMNGSGLGEVCVAIRAFVTTDDLEEFSPVPLTKRLCQARPDLSADDLAKFVKEEAIIQALYDYDMQLAGKDRTSLLGLMKRIDYLESGFLKDTTTYCAEIEGYVTPVEVLAFVSFDGLPATADGSDAAQRSASSETPRGYVAEDRMAETCADTIEFGQMLECSLDNEGQKNRHSFEAQGGDRIVVTVVRTSGDLQPSVSVNDRTGQTIPETPGYNSRCNATDKKGAQVICTLEKSGSYSINVESSQTDTTGSYRLDLQRLNSPGFAIPIALGEVAAGVLAMNWETHHYTFSANTEDRIDITLVRTSGDIEPWFEVYDQYGVLVPETPGYNSRCAASGRLGSQLICTLDKSGVYVIRVGTGTWDYEGQYLLGIQRLNSPQSATSIEFDESVEGTITQNLERHYYTFTANPEDRVDIIITRTNGDIEPWFELYDKTGALVPETPGYNSRCSASDKKSAQKTCTLEKSGVYTIVVGNNAWDYTGSYRVTVNR